MRRILAPVLILACGLALPAAAQPAPPPPEQPTQDKGQAEAPAAAQDDQAAAALALSIRQRQAAEQRIARIACAAGDKAKCALLEKAEPAPATTTPSR